MKIDVWWFFPLKSVEKIQVYLICDKKNGYFTDLSAFVMISRYFLLWMRNVPDKSFGEIKTHILCGIRFFRKPYYLWNNVENYDAARQATSSNIMRRRMNMICLPGNYEKTQPGLNIFSFSTANFVMRRRFSVTLHLHILSSFQQSNLICTEVWTQ